LNQNSIVLKVTYSNVSFLLMGDAGIEAESSLLSSGYNLKSDILKVGHHGSSSASSSIFLARVKPTSSVIEVGAGNDYGHPTSKTLSALQGIGSKIYRTDLDGDIVITTDGQSYSVSTEKQSGSTASTSTQATASVVLNTSTTQAMPSVVLNTSTQATTATTTITTTATASQEAFVGSVKSNKYHYPSCQWAQKIKPSNEIWFSGSADARAHGYVPCGVCHPP
jgi:beta-lactamase superfamily II metal-dependent hydrolase